MKSVTRLLAAACVLAPAAAWAYIPPSSFILKSLTAKHSGIKGLRIRSMVTVMDGEKPGNVHFKAVTYFNPATETLHAYAYDDRNQKLYAIERRPETQSAAAALLFWHDDRNLAIVLKARGIPVRSEEDLLKMKDEDERRSSEEEHLMRWNSAIAWVIGGTKDGDAQLWVEKDTFLPLRLIAGPQPDSDLVDVQLDGQRYYHEFPYPKTITAIKRKQPLFKDEVQDVLVASETSEFRSTPMPGLTEAGNSASSALRELVQKYFEVLR
jgi:hypothetical protein